MGRSKGHRKRTLQAMSNALIENKRIQTTVPKAKALRPFVEPLITRAKEDTTHNRRQVFRHLQDKRAVRELFNDVAVEVGDRTGGYTRIIKLGRRTGDGAERAMIELVDYNDVQPQSGSTSRRTRRSGGSGDSSAQPGAARPQEEPGSGAARPQEEPGSGAAQQDAAGQEGAPGKPEASVTETTNQQESLGGAQTDAVEAPVPEDQKEPVLDRTEARDEAVPDETTQAADANGDTNGDTSGDAGEDASDDDTPDTDEDGEGEEKSS
jgi:large subunit ribosomal protein L17